MLNSITATRSFNVPTSSRTSSSLNVEKKSEILAQQDSKISQGVVINVKTLNTLRIKNPNIPSIEQPSSSLNKREKLPEAMMQVAQDYAASDLQKKKVLFSKSNHLSNEKSALKSRLVFAEEKIKDLTEKCDRSEKTNKNTLHDNSVLKSRLAFAEEKIKDLTEKYKHFEKRYQDTLHEKQGAEKECQAMIEELVDLKVEKNKTFFEKLVAWFKQSALYIFVFNLIF